MYLQYQSNTNWTNSHVVGIIRLKCFVVKISVIKMNFFEYIVPFPSFVNIHSFDLENLPPVFKNKKHLDFFHAFISCTINCSLFLDVVHWKWNYRESPRCVQSRSGQFSQFPAIHSKTLHLFSESNFCCEAIGTILH